MTDQFSTANHAANEIRRLIASAAYRPGDRLPPERELATTFKIGRPALREGIRRLIAAGILEARRGSGTYVADVNLADVFAVRLSLEPLAAGLAARRRTEAEARELLALQIDLMDALSDPDEFAAKDLAVHAVIAGATRNRVLKNILLNLTELTKLSRSITAPSLGVRGATMRAMKDIVRAISAGDEIKAAESMRGHIESVREYAESSHLSETSHGEAETGADASNDAAGEGKGAP